MTKHLITFLALFLMILLSSNKTTVLSQSKTIDSDNKSGEVQQNVAIDELIKNYFQISDSKEFSRLENSFIKTPIFYLESMRLKSMRREDSLENTTVGNPELDYESKIETKFNKKFVLDRFPNFVVNSKIYLKEIKDVWVKGDGARVQIILGSKINVNYSISFDFYLSRNLVGEWKIFRISHSRSDEKFPMGL